MLLSLVAAVGGGWLASLWLTPRCRRLAWRWRIVDQADGERKLHRHPVPLLGGVAVLLGAAVGLALATGLAGTGLAGAGLAGTSGAGTSGAGVSAAGWELSLGLLAGAVIACGVGCWDDIHGLRVRWKLLGQSLAAVPVVLACPLADQVELLGQVFVIGTWGIPLQVAILVGGMNALNFLDGADGVAASIGATTATCAAILGIVGGAVADPLLALAWAGALVGFLAFNRSPASVYLGDAGSLSTGLVVSGMALAASRTDAGVMSLTQTVALLAIPAADLGLAVVRRVVSGRCFWVADRHHIHHCLLARGHTASGVAWRLCALAASLAAAGIAARVLEQPAWVPLAWVAVGWLAVRLRWFGVQELELLGSALRAPAWVSTEPPDLTPNVVLLAEPRSDPALPLAAPGDSEVPDRHKAA